MLATISFKDGVSIVADTQTATDVVCRAYVKISLLSTDHSDAFKDFEKGNKSLAVNLTTVD